MARPVLAIGGIALIAVGVLIAVDEPSAQPAQRAQLDGQVAEPVHQVVVDNGARNVAIRGGDVVTTTVHQQFHYRTRHRQQAYRLDGDTLRLSGCAGSCTVDYDVVVPRGTAVSGTVSSGDVLLERVGPVDVRAASGNIVGLEVAGPVHASAGSGDITLGVRDAQDVRAQADSGDIAMTVPDELYRVAGTTDAGSREIGVRTDPGAQRLLRLDSHSGDVHVRSA